MRCANLWWRRSWTIGVSLACWLTLAPPSRAADPLADLRQALPLDDNTDPKDAILKFREDNLAKKIAALRTVGELRRALALNDWRDGPDYASVANEKIRRIDAEMRGQVGKRLTEALEKQAWSPDPTNRLAVASLLAEMGPSVRALNPKDKTGFAASFLSVVKKLAGDADLSVRQEALRALGNLNGNAKEAAQFFAGVLRQQDAGLGPRRLAAEGLAQMVRVVTHLHKAKDTGGVTAELFETLAEIVHASTSGFDNADAQVRILTLEAFQLASQSLNDSIKENYTELQQRSFPPPGRALSDREEDQINKLYNEVQYEVNQLKPIVLALRQQITKLTPTLRDPDAGVRLGGMNSLNQIANAGQRLRRYVLTIPVLPKSPTQKIGKDRATMIDGLDPLELFLPKNLNAVGPLLSEPDGRVRRAAATFLLLLDERALPMVDRLTAALTDSDRAIRWIATRSLQNLPPEKASQAVSNLATLLSDPDLSVRLAAAATLEGMGPHASAAVDSLAEAVLKGDADGRLAALRALVALGPNVAKAAVPNLIKVLGQPDAEPKVIVGAAEALAQIGAAARSAVPALRQLISHDNPEVRLAASEAILAINAPPKK